MFSFGLLRTDQPMSRSFLTAQIYTERIASVLLREDSRGFRNHPSSVILAAQLPSCGENRQCTFRVLGLWQFVLERFRALGPKGCKRTVKPWLGGEPFNSIFGDLALQARARMQSSLAANFGRPCDSEVSLTLWCGSDGSFGTFGSAVPWDSKQPEPSAKPINVCGMKEHR